MERTIVFDLDGTLVDSADAILSGMKMAVESLGRSVLPGQLHAGLIGPPLKSCLRSLMAGADDDEINLAARRFAHWYDKAGVDQTEMYAGVDSLLSDLACAGARMFVVTNKRNSPTQRLMERFGWRDRIEEAICLDGADGPFRDKVAMLIHLRGKLSLPHAVTYVGDTEADYHAAMEAGFQFVGVNWGYGAPTCPLLVDSPDALGRLLLC